MKKFILPLLASVILGMTVSSCAKEEMLDSVNIYTAEYIAYWDKWTPLEDCLAQQVSWPDLTEDIIKYGTVSVYAFADPGADFGVQYPLPDILPLPHGTEIIPRVLRYEIQPGYITFYMQDLNRVVPDITNDSPIKFRMVASVPVRYILHK